MHILAPIGKLILISINYFQDENNKIEAINELEKISTTEYELDAVSKSIESFSKILKEEREYLSYFAFATFSKIFENKNQKLSDIFNDEFSRIKQSNPKNVSNANWFYGFMSAVYCISVSNYYSGLSKPKSYPEDIEAAIKYIEKHNYKVEVLNVL